MARNAIWAIGQSNTFDRTTERCPASQMLIGPSPQREALPQDYFPDVASEEQAVFRAEQKFAKRCKRSELTGKSTPIQVRMQLT